MTPGFPRLVATDLDGTIVRSDGTISPRTVATLSRIEKAGAQLVFVTGRPPRLLDGIIAAFGSQGVAICSNGALVYDMHSQRVIAEHLIPPKELAGAVAALRAAIPGIGLAVESAGELAGDHAFETGDWDSELRIERLDDPALLGKPTAKLLGRHPRLSADELVALATPAIGDIVTVSHSNGKRLVEVTGPGVSKASALAELAAGHGITAAEVVAFGDMPNDVSMLAWAGTSYGMANAHPDVLAAVDQVIGTNDEDAVAEVIDRLFPPV